MGGAGGGGGSWPPALWWGMSCCAPSEEPKRAGCLVDDSSGNHAFCSHRGGFNVMCRRGAPRVLPWGPASPGAKRDQARAQRGWGQCASLMAAGVRALDAAWGGPAMAKKSPRRESPCKPSLAFWGQGMGVGEILGCHFFFSSGKWVWLRGSTWSSVPAALLRSPFSLLSLSDFVPIDLEEWWAQQFLAKIENCS